MMTADPSPSTSGPILIIEDDKNIAALVDQYLTTEGFHTIIATDGVTGLAQAKRDHPILIILDLMLPGIDGWEICREIRKVSDVPILMLTARTEEIDRILGLSLGADDYVVKPFSPREVVERVKAILRRLKGRATPESSSIQRGNVFLDPEKQKVTVNRKPVFLTPSEYKILLALMSAPGRVFSRDELLGKLYGTGEAVVDRVVDVHIGKIRQKIESDPSKPTHVLTVRGTGYRFAESEEVLAEGPP
ncbi:MAG: response regulator transcription factor [Nitrospirae bacterium]|nr:response regulator transcription factor [Nitrospirota bacterium]